jgi:5-phospho-D-xylono-1,4-lactonase
VIRTVLGDIRAEELGATHNHEHAFQVSPLLPGDEL